MTYSENSFLLERNRRDINRGILEFLWKWKLATTSTLAVYFSPECKPSGFYSRLKRLRKLGLIQPLWGSKYPISFWVLTSKGFKSIKPLLPPLAAVGYQSEFPTHDLIVLSVHLGDALLGDLGAIEFFSEQELRTLDPEFYPKWAPTFQDHRPDGYWHNPNNSGPKTIALEVELNRKTIAAYESIGRYYEDMIQVECVLWIVPTPAMAEKIQKDIFNATGSSAKHSFVLFKDYYISGWVSSIFLGAHKGKTISELIGPSAAQLRPGRANDCFFDARRHPINISASKSFAFDEFRN